MSPKQNPSHLTAFSALFGGFGVLLGAFGAHALKVHLSELSTVTTWNTAVLYHLLHAVAAFAASLAALSCPAPFAKNLARAGWCWLGGIVLFSGSLYGLALGGPRLLGPITPLGGVLFLAGWTWVAVAAFRKSPPQA